MNRTPGIGRIVVDGDVLSAMTGRLAGTEKLQSAASDAVELEGLMKGVDELRRLPVKNIVPPLSFRPVGDGT